MRTKKNNFIVILCVRTTTEKDNVFVKEHFRRTPPIGFSSTRRIHGYPFEKDEIKEKALLIISPDAEGYAGFNFQSCHGVLVFWTPEHPASLIAVAKWTKSIAEFKSRSG